MTYINRNTLYAGLAVAASGAAFAAFLYMHVRANDPCLVLDEKIGELAKLLKGSTRDKDQVISLHFNAAYTVIRTIVKEHGLTTRQASKVSSLFYLAGRYYLESDPSKAKKLLQLSIHLQLRDALPGQEVAVVKAQDTFQKFVTNTCKANYKIQFMIHGECFEAQDKFALAHKVRALGHSYQLLKKDSDAIFKIAEQLFQTLPDFQGSFELYQMQTHRLLILKKQEPNNPLRDGQLAALQNQIQRDPIFNGKEEIQRAFIDRINKASVVI